ncbi:MAG: hypothetical protein CMH46_06910, partial [Muricauda sp.]|nr:hypothetical protein [Allomuricauda sp.]
ELTNDRITFSNWEVVLPEGVVLADILTAEVDDAVYDLDPTDINKFLDNVSSIESADDATYGADTSVFAWTFASSEGAL